MTIIIVIALLAGATAFMLFHGVPAEIMLFVLPVLAIMLPIVLFLLRLQVLAIIVLVAVAAALFICHGIG